MEDITLREKRRVRELLTIAVLAAVLMSAPGIPGVVLAVAPEGACCFADGSCQDLLDFLCVDQNGTFVGSNTSCDTTACNASFAAPILSIFGLFSAVGMLGGLGLYRLLFRRG